MKTEQINCTSTVDNLLSVEDLFGFLKCPKIDLKSKIDGFSFQRFPPGKTHTSIHAILSILSPNVDFMNTNIQDITSKMIRDFVDMRLQDKYKYKGVITIDELKHAIEFGKDVPSLFQFLADYFVTHLLVYRNGNLEAYYSSEKGSPYRKVIILHEVICDNEFALCYRDSDMKKYFDIEEIADLIKKTSCPPLKYKTEKSGIIIPPNKKVEVVQDDPSIQMKKDDPSIQKDSTNLEEKTLKRMTCKELYAIAEKYDITLEMPKKDGSGMKKRLKNEIIYDILNTSN